MSIVHHFFPLNFQVQEKSFLKKVGPIVKLTQNNLKKNQFGSHKVYMSHQRSFVNHFFPFNFQVLEKSFLKKSWSNSETNTKKLEEISISLR